ncbi:MAG: phage terminase large subunit family protein [Planctomycetaceae bacterium]|nr:phage terminase large subunit family protein [Planctomycetaceae bacterium]
MNQYIDDPVAFSSEQQNNPIRPGTETLVADEKTIRSRLNGLQRGVVPINAELLTGFIDVHDDILYWCVTAWRENFTGYVIDYGTFPEQTKKYFRKSDRSLHIMSERFAGRKSAVIVQGVEWLSNFLIKKYWEVENDENALMQIDRLLVDSRYLPKAIETALTRVRSATIKPALGVGVGAKQNPLNEWPVRNGRFYGDYWFEDKPDRRGLRTVTADVNYWKCQVHDGLKMEVGDEGSLSLWGLQPEVHRMFAEHCNAESVQYVQAKRSANEWSTKNGGDNHLFDCMVGCMVAASHCGMKSKESIVLNNTSRKAANLA